MWFIKFKSRLKLRYIKALRIRIASKFSAKSKFSKFLNSCSIMWRKVAYFLSVIGVCVFAQEISTDVNLIKFVYYDASAPSTGVEIVFNDVQSLTASGLKAGVPTTLVIDGFLSNGETPMPKTTKNGPFSKIVFCKAYFFEIIGLVHSIDSKSSPRKCDYRRLGSPVGFRDSNSESRSSFADLCKSSAKHWSRWETSCTVSPFSESKQSNFFQPGAYRWA